MGRYIMCRQSDSLPRSFIFSLLKVPCFPGGPPAGDQTSSKGQDKADIASLPQPFSLYLALRPRLALGGQRFCLSPALLGRPDEPMADFQVPHFPPLISPRGLRGSWSSGLLSGQMAFHLWWEDSGIPQINCPALGIQPRWSWVLFSIAGVPMA